MTDEGHIRTVSVERIKAEGISKMWCSKTKEWRCRILIRSVKSLAAHTKLAPSFNILLLYLRYINELDGPGVVSLIYNLFKRHNETHFSQHSKL